MPIFKIKDKKVNQVSLDLNYFTNEASLRDFFADNLEDLLGMRFLAKEYPTTGGRIDTLAIDETNAPVIIEYKWGQDDAIFTQGLFYFNWLRKNKKHFELLVANKLGKNIKINWSNPRVILISQGFDNRTKIAAQEVNYVELVKYTSYKEDILYLENIYSPKKGETQKSYEYPPGKTNPEVKKIFYELQEKIKLLPNVEEIANQKTGITYRTTKSFVKFEFGKSHIRVLLREAKYNDPKKMVDDITSFQWGYKGMAKITLMNEVNDIFDLIKQSYEQTL
ncbi:MAG: endonuclease NucS [Candidatus Pacebacteria bacterium]|jgi:predicted transport protein|nr:endonuclease NucS [Candidatus Paceibacterota bacterium]